MSWKTNAFICACCVALGGFAVHVRHEWNKQCYWVNSDTNTVHNYLCEYWKNTENGYIVRDSEEKYTDCGLCGGIAERGEFFWVNDYSGVVHNKACEYYENTARGHLTANPTGKDCRACGGKSQKSSGGVFSHVRKDNGVGGFED